MRETGNAEAGSSRAVLMANRLQPLGFPARVDILLRLLEAGELNVSQIGKAIDASQPTVSHHLSALRRAGWVKGERRGRHTVFTVNEGEALRTLLAALGSR